MSRRLKKECLEMTQFITVNTVGKMQRLINTANIVMVSEGSNGSVIYLTGNLSVEVINNFEDIIKEIER
jgi:hypothetical protein